MRLQPPSQLSIALIWVSALFMAIKGGVESWPAATRMFPQMSAGWLSFVPLVLLLVAGFRSIARATAPVPADALATGQAVEPIANSKSEDRRVIQALRGAKYGAESLTSHRDQRGAEKILPEMNAALLSSKKHFGTPMTGDFGTPVNTLEVGRQMIERMLPYLEQGHRAEACKEAEALLAALRAKYES